jgi:signal transduction histidine kinase
MEAALEESIYELEKRVKERTDELIEANEELKRQIRGRQMAQEGLRETEQRLHDEERRMEMLRFANDLALKLMHDLRNPLVTIGGFSRRIKNGDFSEEKLEEYAGLIYEGSMRLENVLNEILTHLRKAAETT